MLVSIAIAADTSRSRITVTQIQRMQRLLAIALVTCLAGCIRRGPEIMTPVRIESVRMLTSPIDPPPVTRSIANVGDDPFRRIDRLEWPGPNQYRTATGSPGPDYWQQRADYTIAATLDTTARIPR